ncbi:aryl-sulfate sulfotransferase [Halosimplex aquaticum]|uniref:Aryl-sulfate sulfotransferase n=1 Tax=Halosimplex aquaticum TaxID=3026162 RepID=A0ABD5XTX6_9EURY|nr:aryl-sulfate sulfotransferase [Halosimplex aquaticum]
MAELSRRSAVRIGFAAGIVLGLVFLGVSFATASEATTSTAQDQSRLSASERHSIAPPTENVTVVAGQGFGDQPGDAITAFRPDGRLLRYNDTYDEYHDVDPVEGTSHTVLYVAANHVDADTCGATVKCTVSVIETMNLSTGETDRLHRSVAPRRVGDNTHDVDRIDEHRLLVADIAYDRVFVLNTTTKEIEWEWEAQTDFPLSGGGPYPNDWTHVNDIEVLPDGRFMVSLRNQDQVVFLKQGTGLLENQTLGAEDDHDVLYEQHNPDFIPAERGGPAVLVADSENDRVVEYQREGGNWTRTWKWSDGTVDWPRDADRLPNGNTLIVDSNGGRVLEVNESGDVVWQIDSKSVYDAERLGTGDESTGGESAKSLGLQSVSVSRSESKTLSQTVRSVLPQEITGAVGFVKPIWMSFFDVVVSVGILGLALSWAGMELWSRRHVVAIRSPITIRGNR